MINRTMLLNGVSALALLAGGALAEGSIVRGRFVAGAVKILWGAVTIALAAALIMLPAWFGGAVSPWGIAAAPVVLGLAVLLLLRDWPPLQCAGLSAALAAAFVMPAALEVAPGLDRLWLSRAAAAAVARNQPPPGKAVLSIGYSEPSLVFLLGTATRLVTATPTGDQLAGADLALVSDRYETQFRQSLASHGLTARALEQIAGLDYSAAGTSLALTLYRLEPG